MARVAAGDHAACRHQADRHLGRIVAFAHRQLRDAAEAEDVAQEAFLRMWRQAPGWRPEARIGTWLHRVALNLCIDRQRQRREQLPETLPELADPTPGPLERHHRQQVARTIERGLAALPERQRTAIILVHYQELDQRQAADVLEVSVDALESLLARGRRGLRDRLHMSRHDLMGEDG